MYSLPWIQYAKISQDENLEEEFLVYGVWTNRFTQYCQIVLQTVGPIHTLNVSVWKFPLFHILANFNIFSNLVGVKWEWMASHYLHFITNWAESLFSHVYWPFVIFLLFSSFAYFLLFCFSYWFEEFLNILR